MGALLPGAFVSLAVIFRQPYAILYRVSGQLAELCLLLRARGCVDARVVGHPKFLDQFREVLAWVFSGNGR